MSLTGHDPRSFLNQDTVLLPLSLLLPIFQNALFIQRFLSAKLHCEKASIFFHRRVESWDFCWRRRNERFKVHQMCYCWWWCCGEDLHAYLLYEQQVPNCKLTFFFNFFSANTSLNCSCTSIILSPISRDTLYFKRSDLFLLMIVARCSLK